MQGFQFSPLTLTVYFWWHKAQPPIQIQMVVILAQAGQMQTAPGGVPGAASGASEMEVKSNVKLTIKKGQQVVQVIKAKNLITNAGLNWFRDLAGGIVGRADGQAVGTGTTAAAAGDIALEASVLKKTIDRRLDSDKKITFQTLFLEGEANGNTLSEVGLFGGGVLIARALITPTIAKDSSISVTIAHESEFLYEA